MNVHATAYHNLLINLDVHGFMPACTCCFVLDLRYSDHIQALIVLRNRIIHRSYIISGANVTVEAHGGPTSEHPLRQRIYSEHYYDNVTSETYTSTAYSVASGAHVYVTLRGQLAPRSAVRMELSGSDSDAFGQFP